MTYTVPKSANKSGHITALEEKDMKATNYKYYMSLNQQQKHVSNKIFISHFRCVI